MKSRVPEIRPRWGQTPSMGVSLEPTLEPPTAEPWVFRVGQILVRREANVTKMPNASVFDEVS